MEKREEYCLIISGGEYSEIPEKNIINDVTYVIACDHGYDHAKLMEIRPDLVIGDFDSINSDIAEIKLKNIEYRKYPSMKDDTDTMLAVKEAVNMNYKNIIMCCAFGGRFDHEYANIQACAYGAKMGATVYMIGVNTNAVVKGANGPLESLEIRKRDNCSLSVFSISDKCENVSISGAEYNVDRIMLTNTFPIGISNEFVEDIVRISFTDGILMIISSCTSM